MMKDFLEGLEANAGKIISEAGDAGAEGGQTFADVAVGAKWGYIPQPKGATISDANTGKAGFGSVGSSLLFIKEHSPDNWDIVVFKFNKGVAMGAASDKAAAAALRKRGPTAEEGGVKKEAKEIARYMALTESILNGKPMNEAAAKAANVEGWTELLSNTDWKVSKTLKGLKFSELLDKCVAVVTPKEGGAKSFLN